MGAHKLTLSMDEHLIRWVHDYSKKKHESISSIVSRYFQSLQVPENKDVKMSYLVMEMADIGKSLSLPEEYDYKREYREAMAEKHGVEL